MQMFNESQGKSQKKKSLTKKIRGKHLEHLRPFGNMKDHVKIQTMTKRKRKEKRKEKKKH